MLNVSKSRLPVLIPLIIVAVLAASIGIFMSSANYDWQGLVLVIAIVGIVAVFLIPHLARRDGYIISLKVLVAGLLLKLGFAMLRNWTTFVVYHGFGDAVGYSRHGTLIAQHIWRLEFGDIATYMQWGTGFIEFFTGVVYSVVGPSIYGGYLVYAFLSFLGSYYFYRAFRIAFPDGNRWLYTLLIFFFPSILYWPNGIGKDALIFLCLGLFAYGCAQIVHNRLRGLLPLVLGFMGTLWIRPHIAAISALSFALAFFLPVGGKRTVRVATFVILLLAVGGFAWLVLPHLASYIGLEELSPQGLIERFQLQQGRTSQGGSAFQAIDIENPLSYPLVMITLLFRPFLWEAHNILALIQSLEGMLVIGLFVWRIKSLGKAIASSISNTYTRYILIYSIAFTIAFSIVANFGIIARERTMFLPFFFMLICFTPFPSRPDKNMLEVTV